MITSDQDYGIKVGEKRFLLNSLLRQELVHACGAKIEFHCFNDLLKGIQDFGTNAGVKA